MKPQIAPACDHVLGCTDPYDAMIPSQEITVSDIPKALKLARDGVSYRYSASHNMLYMYQTVSAKKQAAYDAHMASWDALTQEGKLVDSCFLNNFCHKCGAKIASVLRGLK